MELLPSDLTVLGDKVLFFGSDPLGRVDENLVPISALWVTDGTSAGTAGFVNASNPIDITSIGGKAVFAGSTLTQSIVTYGVNTPGLFVTDGTPEGTHELTVSGAFSGGLFSGMNVGYVYNHIADPEFTPLGSKLLFVGVDASGRRGLWVTDGTSAGTSELAAGALSGGLFSNLLVDQEPDFTVLGAKAVFLGTDASGHPNLWVTDGTSAGTSELTVAGAYSGGLFFEIDPQFCVLGDKVLFVGADPTGRRNLWITDGTSAGTHELAIAGIPELDPQGFAVVGNNVLFEGVDQHGQYVLWITDGTSAGTSEVAVPGAYTGGSGLNPTDLTWLTQAPDIANFSIAGINPDETLGLQYTLANTGGDSTISFYADRDGQNFDGVLVGENAAPTDGAGAANVSLSGLSDGLWHIYAVISDGTNEPQEIYATSTISISGDVLTQTNADGSKEVSTFNITGQVFTSKVVSYAANGQIVSKLYDGVTGEGNLSSFEYLYAGNNLVGSDDFYTGITGQPYTGEEVDYDGAGRVIRDAFSNVTGAPYSAYQYDYAGGVFAGSNFTFTSVPSGASYSSYVVDVSPSNTFSGEQFFFTNITGQSYAGEEEDFDAGGNLSRVLLTGVQEQAYSSLELDYSAGTYDGYKAFYTDLTGFYTNEEVDASASNQLEKVVYSGLTGTPYSSVEEDYSGGALADTVYGYTDVTGQTYNAYQVEDSAGGTALQETFDLNSGGHTLIALVGGQTLTSLGDDKMTGSSTGATTFVFNAVYGADTITNLTSADKVSLPSSEFANFAALTNAAAQSGASVVIAAPDGDTLTLKNMTTTTLAGMSANFAFHA